MAADAKRERKKPALMDQEQVLEKKYALLRKLREEKAKQSEAQPAAAPVAVPVDPLALAARVIQTSGGIKATEPVKLSGFKRPSRSALQSKSSEDEPRSSEDNLEVPNDKSSGCSGIDHSSGGGGSSNSNSGSSSSSSSSKSNRDPAEPPAKRLRSQNQQSRPLARTDEAFNHTPNDLEYLPTAIFVGDLAEDVQSADLEGLCARYGEVIDVHITGKNFGFIQFATTQSAQNAVAHLNGVMLRGSRIRCTRARISHTVTPELHSQSCLNVWGAPTSSLPSEFTGQPTRSNVPDPRAAPSREPQRPTVHPLHRHPALDVRNGTGAPPPSEYEDLLGSRRLTSYEDL